MLSPKIHQMSENPKQQIGLKNTYLKPEKTADFKNCVIL